MLFLALAQMLSYSRFQDYEIYDLYKQDTSEADQFQVWHQAVHVKNGEYQVEHVVKHDYAETYSHYCGCGLCPD